MKVGQWPPPFFFTSLDNLVVQTKTKWCRTRLDDLQHLQDLVYIQNVPSFDQLKYSVEIALIVNMKVDNKLKVWTIHLYLWHRIWRPLILNSTYCYHQSTIPTCNRREDTTPGFQYITYEKSHDLVNPFVNILKSDFLSELQSRGVVTLGTTKSELLPKHQENTNLTFTYLRHKWQSIQ